MSGLEAICLGESIENDFLLIFRVCESFSVTKVL